MLPFEEDDENALEAMGTVGTEPEWVVQSRANNMKDPAYVKALEASKSPGVEVTMGTPTILSRTPAEDPKKAAIEQFLSKKYASPSADFQNKFNSDFSDDKRNEALAESTSDNTALGIGQIFSGLGGALSGRGPEGSAAAFDKLRAGKRDRTVGEFDRRKEGALKDFAQMGKFNEAAAGDQARAGLDDKESPESKTYQALAAKMMPGKDFSQLSGADIERALPALKGQYDILRQSEGMDLERQKIAGAAADRAQARSDRLSESEKDRAAALERTKLMSQQKQGQDDATERVPGFVRTPNAPNLSPTEASGARDTVATYNDIKGSLKEMMDLYGAHGTELTGDVASRMSNLASGITLKLKNLEKLGVLSASDIAMLETQVKDPSSFGQNLAGMLGADTVGSVNKQFGESLDRTLKSGMSSKGYQPEGGWKEGGEVMTRKLKDGRTVKVRKLPNGKYEEVP